MSSYMNIDSQIDQLSIVKAELENELEYYGELIGSTFSVITDNYKAHILQLEKVIDSLDTAIDETLKIKALQEK